jgi:DNA-binding NarL/FixJ family response regulator
MIQLLVVDDHPIVREGLVAVLEDQPEFHVVGTAGTAEEALALMPRLRPDVVLLDLEMPGLSGVEALPRLREVAPETRVIVFTAYDSEERVLGAIRAGAQGYLLKGASADEIAHAIRAVHRGGAYLEPRVASQVLAGLGGMPRATPNLSPREREVLRLVADGLSNKQIAHTLGITERTVKFHISSLFQKLDAENRAQAVAIAVHRDLL